jgi:hypothetical protein
LESQWKEFGRKRKLQDLAKGSTLQGVQGYAMEICRKVMQRVMLESANMTKTGFRVSTSNLASLRIAVRTFKSETIVSRIRPVVEYQSYRRLSQLSDGYLHTLIRSAVKELRVLEVDRAAEILFWTE